MDGRASAAADAKAAVRCGDGPPCEPAAEASGLPEPAAEGPEAKVKAKPSAVDVDDADDSSAWKIDGTGRGGHYHSLPSLGVVMLAQVNYIVSLVVVIPTASGYAASLGEPSTVYFGFVVGVSSLITPFAARVWTKVIRATSLNTVLLINASICLACSLMYVAASYYGGTTLLLVSRVFLGLGSVQTANLKYLGCAVSTKRVKFTHYLTTAAIAYGFAFGTLIAFLLSMLAARHGWDQYTLPGWFVALTWSGYILLHRLAFVEPDLQAGVVDPESKIQLDKTMRPELRREPLRSLAPCLAAIFAVAVIKGAFEVTTIKLTEELWQWDVMTSAMFLGVTMFLVALTTLLSWRLEKKAGEGWTFVSGLLGASLLLPFYYIPISLGYQESMTSTLGKGVYFLVSILALSSLNLGRTIAFSLITELPSPHWRNYFLVRGSELFTVGRGVGPILAGCIADRHIIVSVLIGVCAAATAWVGAAFARGMLEHEEHEVGPARAEEGEAPEDSWEQTMDGVMRDIDEWWSGLGFPGRPGTPARGHVSTPALAQKPSLAAQKVVMGVVVGVPSEPSAAPPADTTAARKGDSGPSLDKAEALEEGASEAA